VGPGEAEREKDGGGAVNYDRSLTVTAQNQHFRAARVSERYADTTLVHQGPMQIIVDGLQ
jgi:hypothetical protein